MYKHTPTQALSEPSDLEALRQEKRAIMMEEKRLKALLDLEKASAHRKADLLVCRGELRKRQQRTKSSLLL